MGVSTAPTFKAALKSRLEADDNFSDMIISRGNPYPDRETEELVIIGDAVGVRMEFVGMPTTTRQEEYQVEMVVSVLRSSRERFEDLEDRAYAIAGYIETSLINWHTADTPYGGVVEWALMGELSSKEAFVTDPETRKVTGREASVTFPINIVARI